MTTIPAPSDFPAPPVPLGRHLIVEFHDAANLEDPIAIGAGLEEAAREAGAVILQTKLHNFGEGMGVTGVVLLAESHISIHTWPEHNYAAIDVFMCGDARPDLSVEHLKTVFRPGRAEVMEIARGAAISAVSPA